MKTDITLISETNISVAWAKAFLAVMAPGVKELSPLVVKISGLSNFGLPETMPIRTALDEEITRLRVSHKCLQNVHTVANTIFPVSLWNRNTDAEELFLRFEKAWPRIRKCTQNRHGSYFRRMTSFRGRSSDRPINQLEKILEARRAGIRRRSAFLASVFDPALDHKIVPRLGFPCLQQVSFAPDKTGGLIVTGNYATQYLFDRGYGNYLGLCRLGQFMAKEMGLELVQLNCIASVAQRGKPSKSDLRPLTEELTACLDTSEGLAQ